MLNLLTNEPESLFKVISQVRLPIVLASQIHVGKPRVVLEFVRNIVGDVQDATDVPLQKSSQIRSVASVSQEQVRQDFHGTFFGSRFDERTARQARFQRASLLVRYTQIGEADKRRPNVVSSLCGLANVRVQGLE